MNESERKEGRKGAYATKWTKWNQSVHHCNIYSFVRLAIENCIMAFHQHLIVITTNTNQHAHTHKKHSKLGIESKTRSHNFIGRLWCAIYFVGIALYSLILIEREMQFSEKHFQNSVQTLDMWQNKNMQSLWYHNNDLIHSFTLSLARTSHVPRKLVTVSTTKRNKNIKLN